MSNYGTMVSEIRTELRRSGIDADIKRAIAAAVQWYKTKRFVFNEKTFTFSTVAGTDTYTSSTNEAIGRIARFDGVYITIGSTKLPMEGPIDNDMIERQRLGSTTRSLPSAFAYVRQSIRFDVPPAAVYMIQVDGILEMNDTSQSSTPTDFRTLTRANYATMPDSFATAFFTDGFEFIKAWAKGYVYQHTFRNSVEASGLFKMADAYAGQITSQAQNIGSSSTLSATAF